MRKCMRTRMRTLNYCVRKSDLIPAKVQKKLSRKELKRLKAVNDTIKRNNQEAYATATTSKACAIFAVLSFISIIAFFTLHQYPLVFRRTHAEEPRKLSQILGYFAESCKKHLQLQEKIEMLALSDPLSHLKTDLQPLQDTLTSIKTQTSQYEKMEQIPGGPTYFMSTSLLKLQEVLTKIKGLDAVAARLLNAEGREIKLALRDVMIDPSYFQIQHQELLAAEEIYLNPSQSDHDEKSLKAFPDITFSHIAALFQVLSAMYAEREEIQAALNGTEEGAKITAKPTEELQNLLRSGSVLKGFENLQIDFRFVDYLDFFELFFPLRHRSEDRALEIITRYDLEKERFYFGLRDTLLMEWQQLNMRMKNLGHKYVKTDYKAFQPRTIINGEKRSTAIFH